MSGYEKIKAAILAGPDCPAKRFLLERQAPGSSCARPQNDTGCEPAQPMPQQADLSQPRAACATQSLSSGAPDRLDLRKIKPIPPAPGEQPVTARNGRWVGRPWTPLDGQSENNQNDDERWEQG